jgi:hypothetical protein
MIKKGHAISVCGLILWSYIPWTFHWNAVTCEKCLRSFE